MKKNIFTFFTLFSMYGIVHSQDIKETTYTCFCKSKNSKSVNVPVRWGTDPYEDPLPKARKRCQEVCAAQKDEVLRVEAIKTR